jgi:2-C-methyl-D-erythritol 4-phosphate cytidylyltransferase
MSAAAIIVAGGEGVRMRSEVNKVFLPINGRSIVARSLELFQSSSLIDEIVLVARVQDLRHCEAMASQFTKLRAVVAGGDVRHRSEFAGLRAIASRIDAGEIGTVLVHDAVRPFAGPPLLARVIEGISQAIGCVPGLPVDRRTVQIDDGWIAAYPTNLWAVQTPQAFQATWLLEAHNKAARQGFVGTDTASVVEWAGGEVRVIEGDVDNIKITTPADLQRAQRIAASR